MASILLVATSCRHKVFRSESAPPKRLQYLGQRGADCAEFLRVSSRELSQALFSLPRQFDQCPPAVGVVDDPAEKSELGHSVHEFDCGVVLDEEQFRQFPDGDRHLAGKALDGQQCLMLLGRQAGFCRSRFAECEKFPKLEPEVGQGFIIDRLSLAPDGLSGAA